MLTSQEFRDRWCDDDDPESLVVFSRNSLADVSIPEESILFLTTSGLPDSAAPFLNFRLPDDGVLRRVADVWQLASEYNRYWDIGSNGSGDPICIDEACDGQIVYLNHDYNFHRVLINSSIPQLAAR